MVAYQSVGCQLEALPYYRRSVKKLVGLVTQNGDFDNNSILEKNRDFDLGLKNRYSNTQKAGQPWHASQLVLVLLHTLCL